MAVDRRQFLLALGSGASLALCGGWARARSAAQPQSRLLVVLLRGGMDGLHLLPPLADPAYPRLRGALALPEGLPLDGQFALHPALPFAHQLYRDGQLAALLAVAPPYRQRSHFEAQDCLENGSASPHGLRDGWMARALQVSATGSAVAVAPVLPLTLRGSARARTWSPPLSQRVDDALWQRLQTLYAADAELGAPFDAALRMDAGHSQRGTFGLVEAVAAATRLMQGADGAGMAFVEDGGWDTHRNQAPVLARKFGQLDAALRAARDGLGADWARTMVLVVSEFGRTAAVNGSGGTDHGTGGIALLAGGAVRGGRLLGDWPGLAPAQLNEGRDVRATTDLRALCKGVLAEHVGLHPGLLETRVFPDSRQVRPLRDLIRTG